MSQTTAYYPLENEPGWGIGEATENEPGYEFKPEFGHMARESAEWLANDLNGQLGLSDKDVARIMASSMKPQAPGG